MFFICKLIRIKCFYLKNCLKSNSYFLIHTKYLVVLGNIQYKVKDLYELKRHQSDINLLEAYLEIVRGLSW